MTKYHQVHQLIENAHSESSIIGIDALSEKLVKAMKLVNDLHSEYILLSRERDKGGTYGISFTVFDEGTERPEESELMFSSKERRDNIYNQWKDELHWDIIFNKKLEYPTPPNMLTMKKIFIHDGQTYDEKY